VSTYQPDHKSWHDKIHGKCTCELTWRDRDLVDDRCQYHRDIEVLDEYEFGPLLGKTLYRRATLLEMQNDYVTTGSSPVRQIAGVQVWR